MITKNTSEKKKLTLLFAAFYASSAVMLILIFTVLWNGSETDSKTTIFSDEQQAQADGFLRDNLNQLLYLDRAFAALLTDSGMKANFGSTFNAIQQAELKFKKAIDSINTKFNGTKNLAKLNEIISTYKAALENRKTIDDMQRGITMSSQHINKNQDSITALKINILKKDSSISVLNDQLKTEGHTDRYAVSFPSTDYILLKNENKYLKSELKLMEAKLAGQRNSKNSLNEATKAYVNLLTEDPAKSSTPKTQRANAKTTSYSDAKGNDN